MKTRIIALGLASLLAIHQQSRAVSLNWVQATADAGWSYRWNHTSVVYDGRMWIMGGNGNGREHDVWFSTNGVQWTQATAAAAWSGRVTPASAAYDGRMWVLGGEIFGDFANDVWSTTDGVNWTQATAAAAWSKRYSQASPVYDGRLWVMGGNAFGPIGDVWYTTNGANWTRTAAAAWPGRYWPASCVFADRMWVMSGYVGSPANDVWHSANGVAWTRATAAAPWAARVEMGCVVHDGRMWTLGGTNYTNDVWTSTDGASWTQDTAAAPWGSRSGFGLLEYGDTPWIIGGLVGEGRSTPDVWYVSDGPDVDSDGVPDPLDNCVNTANSSQADTDGDGVGDACDACPGFDDADDCNTNGVADGCDIGAGTSYDCNGNILPDECETNRWIGRDRGLFTNAANWSPAGVPMVAGVLRNGPPMDNTCILDAAGETTLCYLEIGDTVSRRQSLVVDAGSGLRLRSGIGLNGSGAVQALAASRVLIDGPRVSLTGELEVRALATVAFDYDVTNSDGGRITLFGGALAGPRVTNALGGEITGAGTIDANVLNEGDMIVIADTLVAGDLENNGTITIQGGVLSVTGNLFGSGAIVGGFGGR